jgi:DNA polymerase V
MNPTNMLLSSVCAGSPLPIEETEDFNLAEYLIRQPHQTFFFRVSGESMRDAGIFDGDILIVDKSLQPTNSDIVVAQVGDGYTVKRYHREKGKLQLVPANPDFKPLHLTEDARVCGVALFSIHRL